MAILFLDSSALVKRYIAETGSAWISALMSTPLTDPIYIGVVTGAEVIAALARRERGGSLNAQQASRAITEFEDDWLRLFELVMVDRAIVSRAMF